MASGLIYREDAKDFVRHTHRKGLNPVEYLDEVPAADVRPVVRGFWIKRQSWSEGIGMGESYGFYYDCSVCNRTVRGDFDGCRYNFCPNCGADMRKSNLDTTKGGG